MVLERQRVPDWERSLSRYLDQKRPLQIDLSVVESSAASMPWNFGEEMGVAVSDRRTWQWQTEQLPFPPDALRCVLIRRLPTGTARASMQPTRQVLYLAHHTDGMWRVGWVVHEGPVEPLDSSAVENLSRVGCTFESALAKES